ncbi:MAG: bifunctional adenosylcobinamide kinase/adenosylcobinamide-phosphate guanylyltransferase [Pseudomonadota bacterium]
MSNTHFLGLIFGGARSGKSARAETLALSRGLTPIYLATAQAGDSEMRERIEVHQTSRADKGWTTIEEQRDIKTILADQLAADRIILIDCLTLWLTNILLADADIEQEISGLSDALDARKGPVICVSNEVGLGIVPDNALARAFRDHQGRLNQRIAAIATHVEFVAAGLPLTVKEHPHA